jgi:hypothetical protein
MRQKRRDLHALLALDNPIAQCSWRRDDFVSREKLILLVDFSRKGFFRLDNLNKPR